MSNSESGWRVIRRCYHCQRGPLAVPVTLTGTRAAGAIPTNFEEVEIEGADTELPALSGPLAVPVACPGAGATSTALC